jgi:hypothetical protein
VNAELLTAGGNVTRLAADDGALRPLGRLPAAAIALLYGLTLACLPLMAFQDRDNYLDYARDASVLLARSFDNPLIGLVNEPLWLLLNAALGLVLTPEQVVRTIIFLPAAVVAYVLLRASARNWAWLLLFLLLPAVLKNHITHLRQGAAIAVFLAGWHSDRRIPRWALMGLAPFVHASFFFVLGLHVLSGLLDRLRLANDVRAVVQTAVALVIGISLGAIAVLLGARQASGYEFAGTQVSGAGFAFWLLVCAVFLSARQRSTAEYSLAQAGIVFYLGTYFFVEVTARVFESLLPVVLLAGCSLQKGRRIVFVLALAAWTVVQWIARITQDGPIF